MRGMRGRLGREVQAKVKSEKVAEACARGTINWLDYLVGAHANPCLLNAFN